MSRLHIVRNLNGLLKKFGWILIKNRRTESPCDDGIRINIGSGDWTNDGWTNLDYPSDWYKNAQKKHKIIPYDIRNDALPFPDNSVTSVYCSHVIEHIENKFIEHLFSEIYRVLKPGGCARICCPDAEFLYQVARSDTSEFWSWRNEWYRSAYYDGPAPRPVDYLVREVATPKLLYYKDSINHDDYIEQFNNMTMVEFFEFLTKDLAFRDTCVGDHINYWTFDKMQKMLASAGFRTIVRSKWSGSLFKDMQDMEKFDVVCPNMSLYVEVIK